MRWRAFAAAALLLAVPAPLLAQPFDSLRIALRIPGLAVVVLRDTTVVFARGFGFADVERRVPVTPETPFNTASVAKPVSAVVALRLAQDGRLDLDRPMRRFEGFAEFCESTRSAGGVFFADFTCASDELTLRHVLTMTANGERPGRRFWYNPPSFSWASRPMAEVAGRTFSELVDSLVFRPAGMRNAARTNRRLPMPARIAEALATPYSIDSIGRPIRMDPPPPQGDGAAGGVIASAMDLARFDVALMNGRLLTPARRAQLWEPARTASGAPLPYGLGWFLGELDGRRVAWHTGLWEGRYSALYLKVLGETRADRHTLILLANSDAVQWPTRFDEAAIERSPFARAFVASLPPKTDGSQLTVTMRGQRFLPARIVATVGDSIRFDLESGGPHNIAFNADSIPAGARDPLALNLRTQPRPFLMSEMLLDPGESLVLSLAGLPPGTYYYYCAPHYGGGMRGELVITARPR